MLTRLRKIIRLFGGIMLLGGMALLPVATKSQVAIDPQIYAQVNGYLTGSVSAPADPTIITRYASSGAYALVGWAGCPFGLDTGGQALLTNASGSWMLVHGTGGAFLETDLENDGVDAADATALLANLIDITAPNCVPFEQSRTEWPGAPRSVNGGI